MSRSLLRDIADVICVAALAASAFTDNLSLTIALGFLLVSITLQGRQP